MIINIIKNNNKNTNNKNNKNNNVAIIKSALTIFLEVTLDAGALGLSVELKLFGLSVELKLFGLSVELNIIYFYRSFLKLLLA